MNEFIEQLAQVKADFDKMIAELAEDAPAADLEKIRVGILGKKGELTMIMRQMGKASAEDRPKMGAAANEFREEAKRVLNDKKAEIDARILKAAMQAESIDVSYPGKLHRRGKVHPLQEVTDRICQVFEGMGYTIAEGPELELERNNFSLLRIEEGHPARDAKDTFYIDKTRLLRTQTSPVQIRVMESTKPPIRIVCPGRVYRTDTPDATHSPVFHQIEGLVVDEGVTMAHLKGSLEIFAKALFGEDSKIRLRPHHFPFTEPSCEVDVSCWTCRGKGGECSTCKGEGWVEILGAGMVHPGVLENCGIDSKKYSGFAFGIGVERTAMGRWGIDDIRNFYENDLRFLSQFSEEIK